MKRVVFVLLSILCFIGIGSAQDGLSIKVLKKESIKPKQVPHLFKIDDIAVKFILSNNTRQDVKIYGSMINGRLDPVRYLLSYSKEAQDWEYPNPANGPIPWKDVSVTYKHAKTIRPGDTLEFSRTFASQTDCATRFKITVQVSIGKSSKTREIRSQEFVIGLCECSNRVNPESSNRVNPAIWVRGRGSILQYCDFAFTVRPLRIRRVHLSLSRHTPIKAVRSF